MNIVHIIEASFAGVGRHVLDLATFQHRSGQHVRVIYSPLRESASFRNEREALQQTGLDFTPLAMKRMPHPSDLRALSQARSLLRSFEADVVHGHSTKGGLIARLVPTSARRVYTPNAVFSMNPELGRAARRGVGLLERVLARRTDLIIAVSPEEAEHLRDLGIDPHRMATVPNGVAPAESTPRHAVRETLGLPLQATIVGFVGRLDRQKAPEVLISAFERAARDRPDVHLAMVGAGQMRTEIAQLVEGSHHSERIHLLGEQPGRWAMDAFDIFALPSRYEGFPYVLIEAAQAGLPLLTTMGAAAELLFDRQTPGRRVAVDDAEAFADALAEMLDIDLDPLGRASKAAGMQHTADRMGRETQALIDALSHPARGTST